MKIWYDRPLKLNTEHVMTLLTPIGEERQSGQGNLFSILGIVT